jgi:hypothetical protein
MQTLDYYTNAGKKLKDQGTIKNGLTIYTELI